MLLRQKEALLQGEGGQVKLLEDVALVTSLDAKRSAVSEFETSENIASLWSPGDHCLVTAVTPWISKNDVLKLDISI